MLLWRPRIRLRNFCQGACEKHTRGTEEFSKVSSPFCQQPKARTGSALHHPVQVLFIQVFKVSNLTWYSKISSFMSQSIVFVVLIYQNVLSPNYQNIYISNCVLISGIFNQCATAHRWTARIFKTCNTWLFSQGHWPLFPYTVKLKMVANITIAGV